MASSEQPVRYPRWATDSMAAVLEPSEGAKDTGFAEDQEADPGTFNWLHNTLYDWLVHLDERCVGPELIGRDAATWVEASLGYEGPANTALLTATPGAVWLDGRRLEFSLAYLESIGQHEHTFDIGDTTYVGVNEDREMEFLPVTIGNPAPTPTAGFTLAFSVTVTVGDPPVVEHLLPTGPTLAGPVTAEGPLTIAGDGRLIFDGPTLVAFGVGSQVDLTGWAASGLVNVTVETRSQVAAGTITVDNTGTPGLTSANPTITITFDEPFPYAPQAIVVRNGGSGVSIPSWSWTTTTTELVITGGGGTLGTTGVFRLSWHLLGVA